MCYQIITDATADLSPTCLQGLPHVEILPMPVFINQKEYQYGPDGNLTCDMFYELLRTGARPNTSRISPFCYEEAFRHYLERDMDILYLCFSSGLSGTCQSAQIAIRDLRSIYPSHKIICINTLAASVGEGLLVYEAARKQAQGYNLEELTQWLEAHKMQCCHWFTVDSLTYLKRGGRIGAASEKVGTMLQIKPLLHMTVAGELEIVEKPRGRNRAMESLITKMESGWTPAISETVLIGHGGNRALAEALAALVTQSLPQAHIEITYIGPVIGTHTGPDMLSLCYWGNNR